MRFTYEIKNNKMRVFDSCSIDLDFDDVYTLHRFIEACIAFA
ncbi:MAG: hypothetical protein P4M11_15530 [Candidatus Pacebacteria bacterium]|nr:hypothetical protein [Candidatus Paceibacterota bacterium]